MSYYGTQTDRQSNRLITDAAVEAVSLEEAKQHCRVYHTDEDDSFKGWITAARRYIERATNRTMISATRRLTLDAFPCGEVIYLRYPPVIGITTFTYIDTNGATQTLTGSDWILDTASEPGRLTPAYGTSWPSTQCRMGAVNVTYTAGYGAVAASVPVELRQAMLLLIGFWYAAREAVLLGSISKEIEFAVEALMSPYVIPEYA